MDFDDSILKRVKQRLYGSGEVEQPKTQESDTQIIPPFEQSILFGAAPEQTKPLPRQKPRAPKKYDATQRLNTAVVLPQLKLDIADFNLPASQATQNDAEVPSSQLQKSSQSINAEDFDGQYLGATSTQAQENNLQAQEENLQAQVGATHTQADDFQTQKVTAAGTDVSQRHLLELEIAKATLTDEENDLDDAANTTIDSSIQKTVTTRAELDQIDRDLSEQKLKASIQPQFVQNSFNPVDQLLEAFQSDSEPDVALNSEKRNGLSPNTSPIQPAVISKGDKDVLLDDSDSDFEIPDALDVIKNGVNETPKKKKSPVTDYALRLKKQLLSSPTNPSNDLITLDESDEESSKDVPILSKEMEFLVKQKFSRKLPKRMPKQKDLFSTLRRANAKQLLQIRKDDPDAELIEQIEKEEEEMGNILERELERVRRIRKKEKQQDKAKAALLKLSESNVDDMDDKDYSDGENVPESDGVMDSDYDSEIQGSSVEDEDDGDDDDDDDDDEDNDNGDRNESKARSVKRHRRVILSDDEEDLEEDKVYSKESTKVSISTNFKEPHRRIDDSYMFGGPSSENDEENEDVVTHVHSDQNRPETPISTMREKHFQQNSSPKLFLNLPPRTDSNMLTEDSLVADMGPVEIQSFQELPSTQLSVASENFDLATQKDYVSTQVDPTQLQQAPMNAAQILPDSDSEDDEDFALAVKRGRQSVVDQNTSLIHNDSDDEEASTENKNKEEQDEELQKQHLAMYEAKLRRHELKARKRRKEMERRGKGVFEGEAEESEDEWKGIGGADNEVSDQENSEDERMIDNNFNLVLNDEEVRKKFMEQYQIKDRNELEKLIDDIKNHRLSKRARSMRFDVELSDEEDEILMAYRKKKLEEQKQRLLANKKLSSLQKNEKSRAFFDSIAEESTPQILLESDEESDSQSQETPGEAKDTSPDAKDSRNSANSQSTDADEEPVAAKKVIRLDQAFVQRQLSFLCSTEESKYMQIQQDADYQHGVDENVEDLATLKSRCMSNLYLNSTSNLVATNPVSDASLSQKRGAELLTDDDEENDFGRVFKKPSLVSSFKLYHEKQVGQVSTGSFSGVTVNKQYKVATGAKASITYISKSGSTKSAASNPSLKSSHTQAIERRVDQAKHNSTLFRSGTGFT